MNIDFNCRISNNKLFKSLYVCLLNQWVNWVKRILCECLHILLLCMSSCNLIDWYILLVFKFSCVCGSDVFFRMNWNLNNLLCDFFFCWKFDLYWYFLHPRLWWVCGRGHYLLCIRLRWSSSWLHIIDICWWVEKETNYQTDDLATL